MRSVAFVVPESEPHGGIQVVLAHAAGLIRRGFAVEVVGPGPAPDWFPEPVPYVRVEAGGRPSHSPPELVVASYYTTMGAAEAWGAPVVAHFCQGYEGDQRPGRPELAGIERTYRRPHLKLVVARHLEVRLRELFGSRVAFVGSGIDPAVFHPGPARPARAAGPLRVGVVGTWGPGVRGPEHAFAGLTLARTRGLALEVRRASIHPRSDAEAGLGVGDRYEHRLAPAAMAGFYRDLDLLVHVPFPAEGFGLPVLEAMACGIPVVASDIPAYRELPEGACLRVPYADADALAAAVAGLAEAEARARLARAGVEAARGFALEAATDRLAAALVAEAGPGRDGEAGPGSTRAQPGRLRAELPGLLARRGVRTLLDAPCGDGNLWRIEDLPGDPAPAPRGTLGPVVPPAPPIPEHAYIPYAAGSLTGTRVLVLAPHPDDESFSCGGALALHRRAGDPVKVVVLTDGSRGIAALAGRPVEAAAVRAGEAREAARILGIDDLELWGLPDRGLAADPELVTRVAALLADYRPGLVYTTSPLEAHPDHRAAAALAWEGLRRAGIGARLAFMESSQPLRPDVLVDISAVVATKTAACRAYPSQLGEHGYLDAVLGLSRHRALTLGGAATHAEAFALVPPGRLAEGPVQLFLADQARAPGPAAAPPGPLVSIVVRTRDRPERLREALESLAAQSWRPLEAVVVVDGGGDVGPVLDGFAKRLEIVRVRHPEARGRSAAADAGLSAARGRYLGFLDDDDVLHAGHVARLVAVLEAGGAAGAYGDCQRVEYRVGDGGGLAAGPPEPCPAFEFDRDLLHFENYLPIMTVLFRRELLEGGLGFDPDLEVCEDWDFWLRLTARRPLVRVPGITADYRVFPGGAKDFSDGIRRVYAKHWGAWDPGRLARATWPLVGRLKQESAARDRLLAQAGRDLARAVRGQREARDEGERAAAQDAARLDEAGRALAAEREARQRAEQAARDEGARAARAEQARQIETAGAAAAKERLEDQVAGIRDQLESMEASRAEILASTSYRLGRWLVGLVAWIPGLGRRGPKATNDR